MDYEDKQLTNIEKMNNKVIYSKNMNLFKLIKIIYNFQIKKKH